MKTQDSVMEFEDLRNWWRYIKNNLPQAKKMGCEFARVVDRDIKVGPAHYKKGDILCALCPGLGYIALGGFLPDYSYCRLGELRYSKNEDATLEGKCIKLRKFVKIYN